MDNAGPDGAILILLGVVIYRGEKSCTVLLDKGLFLKRKKMTFATKRSVWPLSTLKTVNSEYRSSLSFALDGQISVQS